jgi:hypothetical protein
VVPLASGAFLRCVCFWLVFDLTRAFVFPELPELDFDLDLLGINFDSNSKLIRLNHSKVIEDKQILPSKNVRERGIFN